MINLLFLSAGRRVELIQEFKRAKKAKGIDGNILCVDMNELSPALYYSDKFYLIPPVKDEGYIPALLNLCKNEHITLVIPTIDTELEILSHNIDKFKDIGTDVLISSRDTIDISQNKLKTYHFFKKIGIKSPVSFAKDDAGFGCKFPCFIKPIMGSSSINAFKVRNQKELDFFKYYIGDYLIQEYIEGEEYTIDVFCDFSGNPIYITPRKRIATRSGEVLKTVIVNDEELLEKVQIVIKELKPKGPITIQVIKSVYDGDFYFIEINARFGGGAPLSMKAGADSAGAVYDLLSGKTLGLQLNAAENGLIYLRFDQSITLRQRLDGSYERV